MANEDEILYGKKQAPALMKLLDEIGLKINDSIRQRGIAKGFVCVQEDFNRLLLKCEKNIFWGTQEHDVQRRLELIIECQQIIKEIWIDIRYMYKNKALTKGEIGVLTKTTSKVEIQLSNWYNTTDKKVISG